MKIDRANEERQRPLTLLAEASPGWLISHGKINNVTGDSGLIARDHPAGWANLVLSACRQLRCILSKKTGKIFFSTFKRGETFSGLLPTSTTMVAAEDSAMFCIRACQQAGRWLGCRDPGQYIRATVNRSVTVRRNQGTGSRGRNVL
jgi:hypothetical protein